MASIQLRMQSLSSKLLKEAQKFTDYNIRSYFIRKIDRTFKKLGEIKDQGVLEAELKKNEDLLEVLKRQAILSNMYQPKKSVIEFDEEIITYLEGIVESCDYDELDELEFLSMCGAYIPQLNEIPKDIFLEWFSSVSDSIKNKSEVHSTGNSDHQNIPISSNNSKEIKKNYELKGKLLSTYICISQLC
ncbi:unnamed protein product [Trichobilharzia regenti]|nr:unnamed protein product [Trichobilharzia regenti]